MGSRSISIGSGAVRCKKGFLNGTFFLGGRRIAPPRSRASKSPRQIMSLGCPFCWVQFHARHSRLDRAHLPSSGCSAITCRTKAMSAGAKVRFLKVNAFSMHDGIAHYSAERKEKMMRVSGVVNGYFCSGCGGPSLDRQDHRGFVGLSDRVVIGRPYFADSALPSGIYPPVG